ncbi:DsbA family protein [Azospirillum sp.]|uniref:DsbA family protein n=1 Tax=Azospirillum sp. TaxID=34012 RepID=UPI002D37116A|nr:DsbA family protein [Azospirillum sp.]HYD68286.1 DsbA family protein [Azospirillum sp.]
MTRFRPLLLTAALALTALAPVAQAQTPAFNDMQRRAIEEVVRDYLVKHPEVIMEAIEELQKRERAETAERQKTALSGNKQKIFQDPASPVGGNPQGDVTVVEFFDYQCGYCKAVTGDVATLLKTDGKVRFVYKEFPILGPASVTAAKAALAARAQGKYEALHNALMANKGQLDDAKIFQIAAGAGLDVDKLKKDMATPDVEQAIGANHALAEALGIRGTPAFVVGNELVPGAIKLDEMKKLVALARKG